MLTVFIDADGCPVKEETYKVAARYQLRVIVVANHNLITPGGLVESLLAPPGPDAADDLIAERAEKGDIVITADILLADRCVKRGARVLSPKGEEFTEDSIGSAVSDRELMKSLREIGAVRGGPAPFEKKDRSRFLGKLDQIVQAIKRSG